MKGIRSRLAALRAQDGMTLVEVIVAISIMGIVATAAIALSITSSASAATQQRQEIAVTVANQAMELATSRSPLFLPGTSVSALYTGRSQAMVDSVWAANPAALGLANTKKAWDTRPGALQPTAILPVLPAQRLSGTDYVANILIGDCWQSTLAAGSTSDCGLEPSAANASKFTQLVRIMVVVRWTAGTGCAPTGCTYQTSAIVDPHPDLEWNFH